MFAKLAVALQMLHAVCVQISASKPTTLSDDVLALQELQGQEDANRRQVLALQFVIAKKQLLQSCSWQYAASAHL